MDKNETIHERISRLVEVYGKGKNTVFASLIGSNEANVRGYRGTVMPKFDFLEKIARSLDINLKWLLTGEGDMLKDDNVCSDLTMNSAPNYPKGYEWDSSMIRERVREIIQLYCNGSKDSFSSKVGIAPTSVFDLTGGHKGNPSFAEAKKILSAFPDVNPEWFMLGTGPMLRKDIRTESDEEPAPSINQEYKGAPYYNVDFIGGFDLVMNDQTINPDYYINYPPYNKEGVLWCNITGHSMEPELSNGDIIALKEMKSPIQYLPAGEIYGIVTDDYRTVKRIKMSEKEGFVRLIPSNKSEEFTEQEIPVEMIRNVYAVLGSIRKFF